MTMEQLNNISNSLTSYLGECISCSVIPGFLNINLTDQTKLIELLNFLKKENDFLCTVLTDLFVVDYPDRIKRFDVIYNLLSLQHNFRVVAQVGLSDGEELSTAVHIYSCALWYEREAWDMYGVKFYNNPDLRRILTDYGFDGHPLRKDFPLTGYKEVRYDIEQKKVIYEPVNLTQEFRTFDFLSPWEGTKYVLPGDEKAKEQQ